MADFKKQVPTNTPGDFFVDQSCIDCDACRQLAPLVFGDGSGTARVHTQPFDETTKRESARALLACPVGAIGARNKIDLRPAIADFPLQVDGNVYYCGFNASSSYGATSYFVVHSDGNWMIDSPRFTQHLVRRIRALGGLRYIFLTHRDDVADAAMYANTFGAQRIIHRHERSAQPDAELIIDGTEPIQFSEQFTILPTPGHTRGHCVLLHDSRYLFSGDHLWWSRARKALSASRSVCWYSWSEQQASMHRLAQYPFEWILPGHGEMKQLQPSERTGMFTDLLHRMHKTG